MNIDERLEKLTERHEALAQSMELHRHDMLQLGEHIRSLARTAEADRESIRVLVRTAEVDAENIRALARIAEIHERRPTGLESQ